MLAQRRGSVKESTAPFPRIPPLVRRAPSAGRGVDRRRRRVLASVARASLRLARGTGIVPMLKTLRIRDLAIIEDLVVEFGPGLNLLTGETGAGKSIVVDSLGLATGDRADARLVRAGAERAVVDAVFDLPEGSDVPAWLAERGVDAGEGEVVVRREVASEGSGRVFVNGTPCALSVLRDLGDRLVEIHGQHEHQSLLSSVRHQELLDRYGGHGERLAAADRAHAGVLEAMEARDRLVSVEKERHERAGSLRRTIREIDAVSPRPGESIALESERRVLRNASRVAELLGAALSDLYEGEPSAVSLASSSSRRLAELSTIDSRLEELARRVEAARLELEDAGAVLRDYREGSSFDLGRLESVESRLASLERLRLQFGVDEEAVLTTRDLAAQELATLEHFDEEARRIDAVVRDAQERYREAARELTRSRRAAAERFVPAVEAQLSALALGRAKVEVSFAPARGSVLAGDGGPMTLHPRGAERVELQFAGNPGEPVRPLAKVASGGSSPASCSRSTWCSRERPTDAFSCSTRWTRGSEERWPMRWARGSLGSVVAARSSASRTCRKSRPMHGLTFTCASDSSAAAAAPRSSCSRARVGSTSWRACWGAGRSRRLRGAMPRIFSRPPKA